MGGFFGLKKSILHNIKENEGYISVPKEITKQLEIIGLMPFDMAVLKRTRPYVEENIRQIVEDFYETIEKEETLKQIIQVHSHTDRLKQTLRPHLLQIFEGKIDAEFIQRRKIVAHVHVRINLPTKWYLASFQKLQKSILHTITPKLATIEEMLTVEEALSKILNFEQQLVLEAYDREIQQTVTNATEKLMTSTQQSTSSLTKIVHLSNDVVNTVSASSESSVQATHLSREGSTMLKEQEVLMHTLSGMMDEINAEMKELVSISGEIGSILTLVQDIAEQTNLLSLNASIESARAGEHGRGFAVVANEVGSMAGRTKESTASISDLIKKTTHKVEMIHKSIGKAEQMVSEGKLGVEKANAFFAQINHKVEENKEHSRHILNEVERIHSYLEGINQSSDEVSSQAQRLREMVNR